VNADGGATEQNADPAKQMGAQVEGVMQTLIFDEMMKQRRRGGVLWNQYGR
jgi:hypothetical protein